MSRGRGWKVQEEGAGGRQQGVLHFRLVLTGIRLPSGALQMVMDSRARCLAVKTGKAVKQSAAKGWSAPYLPASCFIQLPVGVGLDHACEPRLPRTHHVHGGGAAGTRRVSWGPRTAKIQPAGPPDAQQRPDDVHIVVDVVAVRELLHEPGGHAGAHGDDMHSAVLYTYGLVGILCCVLIN